MANQIVTWFEIPASDVVRAAAFYEKVLARKVHVQDLGGILHAFFDHNDEVIGGAIVKEEGLKPSKEGVLLYFNCNNEMEAHLARVIESGGVIEQDKRLIAPEIGYLSTFIDTEGNRMAFFSRA
jgi:hypothetical protein